jgi:hypothetical protein
MENNIKPKHIIITLGIMASRAADIPNVVFCSQSMQGSNRKEGRIL